MFTKIYTCVNNWNFLKMENQIIYLVSIKILATILYSVGDLTTKKKIIF